MGEGRSAITPAELSEMVERNPRTRLLDVRTPAEYASVHIQGTYNVPLDLLGEHTDEIQAEVSDPIVLICQSGMRARRAGEALKGVGVLRLHILEGGVNGWVSAGFGVARGSNRVPLDGQVRMLAGALVGVGGLLAITVSPWFGLVPTFVGAGLIQSGMTNRCGMAMLLARLPYNRGPSCDVDAVVDALRTGRSPGSGAAGAAAPQTTGCCG